MSADNMPSLPNALRLAEMLEDDCLTAGIGRREHLDYRIDAANELRSLHAARAYAAEQVRELVEALEVAREEMVASGNWYASDFGWPKACALVDALIAKHKESAS